VATQLTVKSIGGPIHEALNLPPTRSPDFIPHISAPKAEGKATCCSLRQASRLRVGAAATREETLPLARIFRESLAATTDLPVLLSEPEAGCRRVLVAAAYGSGTPRNQTPARGAHAAQALGAAGAPAPNSVPRTSKSRRLGGKIKGTGTR
jgi:hypothetical protein